MFLKSTLSLCVLFFSCAGFAAKSDCQNYKKYADVSLEEMKEVVKKAKAQQATIIDVNSQRTYQKNHIPTAIHFKTHKDNLKKVLPQDKDSLIVAYCGGKMCRAWRAAAKAVCQEGYTNIKHFSAGIQGWLKSQN